MNEKHNFLRLFIIIILALAITAGSYLIEFNLPGQLDAITDYRGLIIPYWSQTHATYDFGTGEFPTFPPEFNLVIFLIDIFIWILILWIIFFVIKKVKK